VVGEGGGLSTWPYQVWGGGEGGQSVEIILRLDFIVAACGINEPYDLVRLYATWCYTYLYIYPKEAGYNYYPFSVLLISQSVVWLVFHGSC
jgi:hypothetical protein